MLLTKLFLFFMLKSALAQQKIGKGVKEDFDLLLNIKDASELMHIIKKRWNQKWLYIYDCDTTYTTSFEKNNIDDICIGVWYNIIH